MRFRSGEYGGRKRNQAPISLSASAARGLLWLERLSRIGRGRSALPKGDPDRAILWRSLPGPESRAGRRHGIEIVRGAGERHGDGDALAAPPALEGADAAWGLQAPVIARQEQRRSLPAQAEDAPGKR